MLPFLKPKPTTGVVIAHRTPDEAKEPENPGLSAAADDLIRAVHSRDTKGVVDACKALWTILENTEEDGPEHASPHSYDAQNYKAGQNEGE